MITPSNQIPPNDSDFDDADDQMSQQDVHSNGFDDDDLIDDNTEDESDALDQAYEAAEPSYELDDEEDEE